jgi:putative peptide zinc metalloprotease protein
MMRIRSRLVLVAGAVITALALLAAPASAAGNDGSHRDNLAYAANTKDGSYLFKLAFDIRSAADGVVDQTNAAVAYASCTACKTVAIAFQVVFVTAAAHVQTPTNVAIAVNDKCTSCQTLATAYQFIVPTDGPVQFTSDGKRAIEHIQAALRELARSTLDVVAIQARVDDLAKQLQLVLATQLVRAPPGQRDDEHTTYESHITVSPSTTTSTAAATSSSGPSSTTSTTGGPTATSSTTSTP